MSSPKSRRNTRSLSENNSGGHLPFTDLQTIRIHHDTRYSGFPGKATRFGNVKERTEEKSPLQETTKEPSPSMQARWLTPLQGQEQYRFTRPPRTYSRVRNTQRTCSASASSGTSTPVS